MKPKKILALVKKIEKHCDNACEAIDEGDEDLTKRLVIRINELALAIQHEAEKDIPNSDGITFRQYYNDFHELQGKETI